MRTLYLMYRDLRRIDPDGRTYGVAVGLQDFKDDYRVPRSTASDQRIHTGSVRADLLFNLWDRLPTGPSLFVYDEEG